MTFLIPGGNELIAFWSMAISNLLFESKMFEDA